MRLGRCTSRRAVNLLVAVSLAPGVVAIATAQSKGRVVGKIVDAQGKAVSDVTVRFTALEADETPHTVEVRKKGRFGIGESVLPGGRYRIDLVESDRYVTRVDYEIRRPDGLRVAAGSLEGHPRSGVVGVPLSDRNEVMLTLVVAPRGSTEAREREMSLSSPELSAAAKRFNEGDYEAALREAERVLAENPESGEAFYVYGVSLDKLGSHAEAESALLQATSRIPDFPRIWAVAGEVSTNLAAELDSSGDTGAAHEAYGRAAEALTRAVERDPDSLALQLNLAVALDRAGDDERLLPVLERILEQDAEQLQPRLRLASLYSKQGRHDDALALLDEIPETETQAAVTIYNIAVALNDEGDADGSLLAARRAAEIDPQLPQPRRLIAQILLGKGDHEAAIDAIRAFLDVAPDDPEADAYARILKQLEAP